MITGNADKDLPILHEDDSILVVVKPAGIAVQSGRAGEKDLVSVIRNYLHDPYIGIIHRLDRQVEGILVFGKTKQASAALSRQVRERIFNKTYDALCRVASAGIPDAGRLTDHIAVDRKNNISRISDPGRLSENNDAKEAVLDYRIVERFEQENAVQIKIDLHTGRHHQIRLQLSHARLPIIGDRKYGDAEAGKGVSVAAPLCLAASGLDFIHPVSNECMSFTITPHIIKEKEKIIADL